MSKINAKTATIFAIIVLMASITPMAMPVQAQNEDQPHGGTPGAAVWGPKPAGVTPDYDVITYAYLSARPNPIGVGQSLLINTWLTPSVHRSGYMTGFTITITKPDGSKDTKGPYNSYYGDSTFWMEYVPETEGTYYLQFSQPGTYFPAGMYNDSGWPSAFGSGQTQMNFSRWYEPSESPVTAITVQADMVASWPPAPLPTDYWTRPVHFELREWYTILGNYPWSGSGEGYPNWPADTNTYQGQTKYQAWAVGSVTSHVLWKRLDSIAGIIGGPGGFDALTSSGSAPGFIYAGRCYQTRTIPINGVPTSCATCYDLRTGEQYYAIPVASGGVTPQYISYVPDTSTEVPGATEREATSITLLTLSGTTLLKINPLTGAITNNITGILSGGTFIDPFVITIQTNNTATGPRWINWTTLGTSNNFTSRVLENRTYLNATSILGGVDWQAGVMGSLSTLSYNAAPYGVRILGYSLKSGALICNFTDTYIPYTTSQTIVDHGKIAVLCQDGYFVCWDLLAGKRAWVSQQTYDVGGYPWGIWGAYSQASYGGNMILDEYDGIYGVNWETGKISWVYRDTPTVPFEEPYAMANVTNGGVSPFNTGVSIVNGLVYTMNTEHTQTHPITRGWKFHCFNATDGKGVWNITTPMSPGAMADGYTTTSAQDGYMYVFGKGKSATTVTAPDIAVAVGTTVLIKGTVLDMSPAEAGTPCVSDDSMTTQMEYLHMQAPVDGIYHNIAMTGVPVVLTALGSNGTVIDIGTTTTNPYYGTFSMPWTPDKQDTYTVTASFAATKAYGSSSAATGLTVGPAPVHEPPVEIPTPVDNTNMLYGILAAVIIAIIIGLAALIAVFRKK